MSNNHGVSRLVDTIVALVLPTTLHLNAVYAICVYDVTVVCPKAPFFNGAKTGRYRFSLQLTITTGSFKAQILSNEGQKLFLSSNGDACSVPLP